MATGVPLPEPNPVFHNIPDDNSGAIIGVDIVGGISDFFTGIGNTASSFFDSLAGVSDSYNRFDDSLNRRSKGLTTQQMVLLGGGALALVVLLR